MILHCRDREVEIRPTGPPVIIGEGGGVLRKGFEDLGKIVLRAKAQVEAGARIIDVNLPARALGRAVREIQGAVAVPVSLDVMSLEALREGLEACEGRALVNSINGSERRLKEFLPLISRYGSAAIAMPIDDEGIPERPEGRLRIAERIIRRAGEYSISIDDLIFDAVCLPALGNPEGMRVTLETLRLLRKELGANLTLGVRNVSYGLSVRRGMEAHFLALALSSGLNCPMTDPTVPIIRRAIELFERFKGLGGLGGPL